MNVLILHSQVPYVTGGAEVLVNGLRDALTERGHLVDTVSLPLTWNPTEGLLTTALAWRLLDLRKFNERGVDMVICTKYPTWAVKHPRKVLWLIHQHRQAYDLYGTPLSEFRPDGRSIDIRRRVIDIDLVGLRDCRPRFTISRTVAERLQRYCGLTSSPLYPPVPRHGLRPEAFEPFVLSVSRLDRAKRVAHAIEAWPFVRAPLRLVIAGDGPDREELEVLAERLGIRERVDFVGRVDDERLRTLYNTCRGVYYAPIDEDYGYVTVEALAAGKPVVTAPDSGGVLEFVTDGESGLVSPLEPMALAEAFDRLAGESYARRLGAGGPALVSDLRWDRVVDSLLGE